MENMDPQHPQNSHMDLTGIGDRPTIKKSGTGSKYKPAASVYLSSSGSRTLTGPYFVASVTSQGKYTLEDANGNKVNGGNVVQEKDLQKA